MKAIASLTVLPALYALDLPRSVFDGNNQCLQQGLFKLMDTEYEYNPLYEHSIRNQFFGCHACHLACLKDEAMDLSQAANYGNDFSEGFAAQDVTCNESVGCEGCLNFSEIMVNYFYEPSFDAEDNVVRNNFSAWLEGCLLEEGLLDEVSP